MEGEGEDAASVGLAWQREKGWGSAVSSIKEGGEGVRARLGREGSGPGKKRGELGLGGALGRAQGVFFLFSFLFSFSILFPKKLLSKNR